MSLEFFEPRPPKVAAIKLDFLDDADSEVAEKLRTMPLVDTVAIEYGGFGDTRTVVINPSWGDASIRLGASVEDSCWLVWTPPPLDSLLRGELEIVRDARFHRRYQPCESESISA